MHKKGFTLIEIIVCIIILGVVGTSSVVIVNSVKKENQIKEVKEVTQDLTKALEVYISNNPEIEKNLLLNAKAAVITLENLKNEGLIKDNIINPNTGEKFNYKNSYFTLLEGTPGEAPEGGESYDCNLNLVGIEVITSWNLNNLNSSDVIYICPRKDYTEDVESLKNSVSDIGSRLDSIEAAISEGLGGGSTENKKDELKLNSLFSDLTYTAKGINPNNYVYFEVESKPSEFAYFQNTEDLGLWRIVTINSSNEIELLYTEPVLSNNNMNYNLSASSTWCHADGWINYNGDYSSCTYYKLNHSDGLSSDYYRYSGNGWIPPEIIESETSSGSKKSFIYNSIVHNEWLVTKKYYPYYNYNSGIEFNPSNFIESKIGVINYNQLNASINISQSWLYQYPMLMGKFSAYYSSYGADLNRTAYNSNGVISGTIYELPATRCTRYDCYYDETSFDHYTLYTSSYYPLITLNSKVELIEPTCGEGKIIGSKECPYKLSCTNC